MPENRIALAICSREETKNHTDGEYSHLLSLLDPERGYDGVTVPKKAKHTGLLLFHDLDDIEINAPKYFGCVPPDESHVQEIIGFFQHLRQSQGHGILVHCEAGISRSTAAAIIGLCALGLTPETAFRHVANINEVGLPNRRMLRLAGKLLGDNGTLLEMAEEHRKLLFQKYTQEDPTEILRIELAQKAPWEIWAAFLRLWIQHLGKTMTAGSDHKMLARWKIKAGMLGATPRKPRKPRPKKEFDAKPQTA